MNGERWKRVEECCHAALAQPLAERARFIAQTCGDDPELRREVESLMAHEGQADALLENPAWNHVTPPEETLAVGASLGGYRIVSRLGTGGMGEVFRATDTKLHREVALKVVAREYAQDPQWLSRFQREARLLASLNHPHIAAIYGLEESAGLCGIAMELVEGATLAQRILKAPVPVGEALAIARQIAEALEYSHEEGIVHRDLKPANVKLRPDGVVKVLDFGLAKTVDSRQSPSETATRTGAVMGTPAYMAPEQAAGQPVDRRADIWAFGLVLFEMLTGRAVYTRKSTMETLAAVARDEPPWDTLPPDTPGHVLRLLRRCLDKDPKRRLRDIGEARIALDPDPQELVATVRPHSLRPARLAWTAAVLLALAAAAGWIAFLGAGAGPSRQQWTLSIVPPPGSELPSLGSYREATPEISPDGAMLVCRLGAGLQMRRLNSTQFLPLRGTQDAVTPFWSPDSRWIGFFVNDALMKMQVPDGAPELVAKGFGAAAGATWGRDGVILLGNLNLQVIPDTGGTVTSLKRPELDTTAPFPHFLPDGEHFLFLGNSLPIPKNGLQPADLFLAGWRSGKWTLPPVRLKSDCSEARYSSANGGSVLFVENDNLYSQQLNLRQARLEGSPVLLQTPVASSYGYYPAAASFSVSSSGILAWRPGRVYGELLTWYDRRGRVLESAGPPSRYLKISPTRDGRRVAAVVWTGPYLELRVLDSGETGFLTILNTGVQHVFAGFVWRPDFLHLLCMSVDLSTPGKEISTLTERSATGSSEERQLGNTPLGSLYDVAPDGTMLGSLGGTLHIASPSGDTAPRPLLASAESINQGSFSPDGRWVLYASAVSREVFVQAFPISGPRHQISVGGGAMPFWRGDGKEILYLGADHFIYSVRADPQSGQFQPAERLFAVRTAPNSPIHFMLAATYDGSQILFCEAIDQPESRVITLAQ